MCWFLCTSVDPRSAVTFCVLEEYQLLLFKSKASSYEFYQALSCRQDNTGERNKVSVSLSRIVSLTCYIYRIVTKCLCEWFTSGATSRCSSMQAEVMTLQEYQEPQKVLVLFYAQLAHIPVRTCHWIGVRVPIPQHKCIILMH